MARFLYICDPPSYLVSVVAFFFQAEDGIRDRDLTGVQTCALPIWVVGATSRAVMEQALDRLDSPPSDALSQNDHFTSVVNRLPTDRIGFFYFDSRPVMGSRSEERRVGEECTTRWAPRRSSKTGTQT